MGRSQPAVLLARQAHDQSQLVGFDPLTFAGYVVLIVGSVD